MAQFTLPDLGENIEGGDVVNILVSEGDQVTAEQPLLEIETDKAMIEVPSPSSGTIGKLHIKAGDTVTIGQALLDIDDSGAPAPEAPEAAPAAKAPAAKKVPQEAPAPAVQAPVAQEAAAPTPAPKAAAPAPATSPRKIAPKSTGGVPAGPATRRMARELGVSLNNLAGSGSGGRVTREDIIAAARNMAPVIERKKAMDTPGSEANDSWGPITRDKMPKIRKTIAVNMLNSTNTIPHVTNFDDADITELEGMRQGAKDQFLTQGMKLTTMPFLIKACAMALRKNPTVNASVDMDSNEIIYKQYINIGIAIDTPRGLVVPSLRNVDNQSIAEVTESLASTVESVRNNKFGIDDLRGSTFTISNLGAIGGTYSTPVINPPEVAILLVGRSRQVPTVMKDGSIQARLMMPLSLSYDHRLVDGGAAARYLNDIKAFLQNPGMLLMGL
ncbi:2-oxo acid dehydrogenase subunit E2 [bacterium AH-315-I18]|nr:2-oxo acid dehydrogenase subunit E2 [bacterium AH-315-I18]